MLTILLRLGLAVLILTAVLATLLEISRDAVTIRATPVDRISNSLGSELRRCQALGDAALQGVSCLNLWAQKRRSFLNSDSTPEGSE